MIENQIFWIIVNFISTSVEDLVLVKLFDIYSKRKRSDFMVYSLLLIPIIAVQIFDYYGLDSNIKLFIILTIDFVYCMFCYQNKIYKAILLSMLYWMVSMGIDLLTFSIVNTINTGSTAIEIMNPNIYRLELIIISKTLLVLSVIILKKLNLNSKLNKKQYISIIIPMVANVLFIVVIWSFVYRYIPNSSYIKYVVLILSILLLFSNASILMITNSIINENRLQIENEKIKEKLELQYKYYLSLKTEQEKVIKFRHDIKNHLLCIKNSTTKQESIDYIKKINLEINQTVVDFNTGDAILDTIFYEKSIACLEKGIKYKFDVDYSKCKFVELVDTCSIFANLLDNAIEACDKITDGDKFIKLKGNVANNFFIVKCENSMINEILFDGENIFTDKKDKNLHGIGLKSIKESFEKYDGFIDIEASDKNFIFKGFLPINCPVVPK